MRVAAILLAAALFSGCNVAEEIVALRLDGAFTQDRTQEDLDDFQATVEPYSDDVAIMESFPEQFVVSGLGSSDCDELRDILLEKDYLATVGECEAPTIAN